MPDPENPGPEDLQAIGDRMERLLGELQVAVIPRSYEQVEEVLRLVTELYGRGLERLLGIAEATDPALMDRFLDDELVASLMMVHGLHPEDLRTRVEEALESIRPFLADHDGNVELLDIDEGLGAVHLRLLGNCDGCPSSSLTLRNAVETALNDRAPEIEIIDVEANSPTVVPAGGAGEGAIPVTLTRKKVFEECPTEMAPVPTG